MRVWSSWSARAPTHSWIRSWAEPGHAVRCSVGRVILPVPPGTRGCLLHLVDVDHVNDAFWSRRRPLPGLRSLQDGVNENELRLSPEPGPIPVRLEQSAEGGAIYEGRGRTRLCRAPQRGECAQT